MRRLPSSSAPRAAQSKGKQLSLLFLKVHKLDMVVEDRKEVAKQALRLGSHEVELNRIDTAIVAAARRGTPLPSPAVIFGALSDASIASADALETCVATPLPVNVRISILRLQCSMTDVVTSLAHYTTLTVRPR